MEIPPDGHLDEVDPVADHPRGGAEATFRPRRIEILKFASLSME